MSFFKVGINRQEIDNLFKEIVDDCDEALRPAAQAGAQVLYDQVKRNVGKINSVTGKLAASIYQAHSKDNSGPKKQTYHVSWNAKKAPHGHLIEYGHLQKYKVAYDEKTGKFFTLKKQPLATPKQVAAQPFVRPAYESHSEKAMDAMSDRFFEELGKRYGA